MDIKSTNLEVIKRYFDSQEEWIKPVRDADKERATKTVVMIPLYGASRLRAVLTLLPKPLDSLFGGLLLTIGNT